jgi:exfoliative toxin A/B
MLPIIAYRVLVIREIPSGAKPLVCIFLAPPNLCLAGYLILAEAGALTATWWVVCPLLVCSALSFIFVVTYCAPFAFKTFSPSFSAFTFPTVIAATAITKLSRSLVPQLAPVATALLVFATFFVVYVLIRYALFLAEPSLQEGLRSPHTPV